MGESFSFANLYFSREQTFGNLLKVDKIVEHEINLCVFIYL